MGKINDSDLYPVTTPTLDDRFNFLKAGPPESLRIGTLPALKSLLGQGMAFETREDVAAKTIESAVKIIQTGGYATAGDGGGALYKRVDDEPTHNLKVQSADDAWWEQVADNGTINVLQAGAPFYPTDSITAFRDCVDFARYNVADEQSGGANGPTIIIPQGKYYWSDTLEPRAAITMLGFKRSVDGNLGTIIVVAADKTGIILPKSDTLGAGREDPDDPLTKGANGSFLQGFRLTSLGGTDHDKHGIHVRTGSVFLSHIECRDFPGNGFHTRAAVGGSPSDETYGNANLWRYEHCFAFGNQLNGFFWSGGDANAGMSYGLNAVNNGRWGLWDTAFLSNTHIAAHCSGNGVANVAENAADGVTCIVEYGGRHYVVIPDQEVAASTTTPGTDETVWFDYRSGSSSAAIPAWSNGNTYISGGSYFFEGDGPKEGFGCYSESDNVAAVRHTSRMMGGANTAVISLESGGWYGSYWVGNRMREGGLRIEAHITAPSTGPTHVKLMPAEDKNSFIGLFFGGGPSTGSSLRWDASLKLIKGFGTTSGNSHSFEILTDLSTLEAGLGAGNGPQQGHIVFPRGLHLGSSTQARHMTNGTAAPTSDKHAKGEIVWNRTLTIGGILGWGCTFTDTPGTWGPIYFAPDVAGNKAARLRVNSAEDATEWTEGPKAGTDTIANSSTTEAVTFATDFASANYSVALSADGDERVWVTSKAVGGFTLNRSASSGARAVDWTVTPHEDL